MWPWWWWRRNVDDDDDDENRVVRVPPPWSDWTVTVWHRDGSDDPIVPDVPLGLVSEVVAWSSNGGHVPSYRPMTIIRRNVALVVVVEASYWQWDALLEDDDSTQCSSVRIHPVYSETDRHSVSKSSYYYYYSWLCGYDDDERVMSPGLDLAAAVVPASVERESFPRGIRAVSNAQYLER